MRLTLPLLLLAGCAVLPVSPRRMGTLEERVATLEKRLDVVETAAPSFSQLGGPEASAPVASVGMAVPYEAATKTLLAARNSGGTMSLVSGNPVVTGTTITSTWANNTLSDIATELTDSLSRSNKGAMLAPLQLYWGSVGAPGLQFSTDTTSGLYRINTNDYGFSIAGTKVQEWAAGGVTLTMAVGAVGTPSLSFSGDSNTGLYWVSADDFAVTVGGVKTVDFTASGTNITTTTGSALAATGGTNGNGVVATGTGSGGGLVAAGGTTGPGLTVSSNANRAAIVMAAAAAPAGPNAVGDMYMAAGGVLKVCTVAGTPGTFVSVGSQP